jgi:hypothetical protein
MGGGMDGGAETFLNFKKQQIQRITVWMLVREGAYIFQYIQSGTWEMDCRLLWADA